MSKSSAATAATPPKRGRPFNVVPSSATIYLRVTEATAARIKEAAAMAGASTPLEVSAWIREALIAAADRQERRSKLR